MLPSPTEHEIDTAFADALTRIQLDGQLGQGTGKRVALRMLVTIANSLAQPVMRESGVMRLPQTIRGLFDPNVK